MNCVRILLIFFPLLFVSISAQSIWNYLTFTQEWPPTFCSREECLLPPGMKNFNIHGLWPTRFPNLDPINCSYEKPFELNSLEPIMQTLTFEWANLLNYKSPALFWKHEWSKHGVCALNHPYFSDELDYFNISLFLKKKLDLTDGLASIGFIPNNDISINRNNFLAQLHNLFKVNVEINCQKSKDYDKELLFDIRVCFNPDLQLIDCPLPRLSFDELEKSRLRLQSTLDSLLGSNLGNYNSPMWSRFQELVMEYQRLFNSSSGCPEEFIYPEFKSSTL